MSIEGTDVVLAEIIRNRLVATTQEMAKTLIRTAFNPLLYEVQDFGVVILSAEGDMWAESPGVMVFSQGFPEAVRAGIHRWNGAFAEGDVLAVNDPFETGTHISDTNIYMPVFVEGVLVAFAGVAAHWADIGGHHPGGWSPDTPTSSPRCPTSGSATRASIPQTAPPPASSTPNRPPTGC